MSSLRIEVEGLRELAKRLAGIDKPLAKELTKTNKSVAEAVRDKMRERATGLGSVAAKSAPNIKALATQRDARISYGGRPYNMGAEFGAKQYKQFSRWLGKGEGAGYFFWPTVRENQSDIVETYTDRLNALIAGALDLN